MAWSSSIVSDFKEKVNPDGTSEEQKNSESCRTNYLLPIFALQALQKKKKSSNIYLFRAHTIFKEVLKHSPVVGEQLTLNLITDMKNSM